MSCGVFKEEESFKMYSHLLSKLLFVLTSFMVYVYSETDKFSRQGVFKQVNKGGPLTENIISSHHVTSWLECGQLCLRENCNTFSHLPDDNQFEINCQLSSQTKCARSLEQRNDNRWTIYEMMKVESENKICQNGGQYLTGSCEAENTCKCDIKYYGKHCENENNDYDISFPSQPTVDSYERMDDKIKTDLNQVTFTAWFKIEKGLKQYYLLSYMADGISDQITLYFDTNDSERIVIFRGLIKQINQATYISPVNDGYWHHLGFTWSNNGQWNVFIDGTHPALRNKVGVGAIIPKGGTLVIGSKLTTLGLEPNTAFAGEISRVNLWDRALGGQEIEAMAMLPGNERGNLISWFSLVESVVGDIKVVAPSQAQNTDQGLDFQLSFPTPTTGNDYILATSAAPVALDKLSVCLWIKTSVHSIFISYNTEDQFGQSMTFGVDSNDFMSANINGSLAKSTTRNVNIINNQWHFLCLTWHGIFGKLTFYYDSILQGSQIQREDLKTTLQTGGNFLIGLTRDGKNGSYNPINGFTGTMSYLNIWSSVLGRLSILPMTSGGVNINGDVLSWRNLRKCIVGNVTLERKTIIRFPGYGLLAKRSKWCNDYVLSVASCDTLYARFGEEINGRSMDWRCYCEAALTSSKYTYNFDRKSTAYYNKHTELIAIVN